MVRGLIGLAQLIVVVAFVVSAGLGLSLVPPPPEGVDITTPTLIGPFRLLSYNVKGTPWPLLSDRTPDLKAIAADLRAYRQHSRRGSVVVLQEAFLPEAKAIGREAGYRYVVFGPALTDVSAVRPTAEDRRFTGQARFWSGEGLGKYVDSGLAMFSDFPILWVRRVAFPDFACAGWDCLADKGALAAAVKIPGVARPVVIVTTHLNARRAAGVPFTRSIYAFQRQLDILNAFISTLETRDGPLLLAGDFNVGSDLSREAGFSRLVIGRGLQIAAAEHRCGHGCDRAVAAQRYGRATLAMAKSMVLFRTGERLLPSALATFGRAANGVMLSDHLGLAVQFGMSPGAPRHLSRSLAAAG